MRFEKFIEQAIEPAEKKDAEDPRQKRLKMIKRQVLMKKVQAVRQGGGEDITASHEPEGEMVEAKEVDKKRHPRDQKELDRAQEYIKKNPKFGLKEEESVPRNSVGKPIRIKDKIKAAKGQISHKVNEGVGDAVKKGLKRHKDAVEKKKIKNRKAVPYAALAAEHQPEGEMVEAKVDKGRSDYGKASIRNYRRSGPGHGEPAMFDSENKRGKTIDKRREEHKARRGVKGAKVPAYKVNEHHQKDKDGKVIEHEDTAPCSVEEELSRRSKPSAKAKMAKLDAVLKRREERKVKEKEALKTEGWLGKKKKEEKKPQKAMDAGARAKRKLQRREYASKVSGSEDNVPDEMREGVGRAIGNAAKGAAKSAAKATGYAAKVGAGIVGAGVQAMSNPELKPNAAKMAKQTSSSSSSSSSNNSALAARSQAEKAKKAKLDARKKAIQKIKDDRRERATTIMTAEKAAKKVKKEGEDKKFKADSEKPIVAEFVNNLWEASHKCKKCGKIYTGKSCSCGC